MVPFSHYGKYTVDWVIGHGNYTADTVVAKVTDETGNKLEFTMIRNGL